MRNLLLTLVTTIVMATSASAQSQPDPKKPVMTEISDGVFHYFQNFYSSLIVVSDQGVIVTDPSGEKRAATMLSEIRKITDKPVKKVIYSHDHFDHTRGGKIFKDQGAQFIAHKKCVELLSRDLEGKVVPPDQTYDQQLSIKLGNKQIDLHYYGPSDGECMSVIHMPKEKVLLAVDWHLQGYVNEPYRLTAHNYVSILNVMKRVKKELEFDHVISGHMAKSSPELFEEDLRFNQALFDAVWTGLQKGKSVDELKKSVKLPEFSHWIKYDQNLPAHVERMAYSIWHGN